MLPPLIEVSSFQLETLSSLRPHVAVILNIAEDHLDRHYNMENYIYLKRRLLKNCTESEYAVLNFDDRVVRSFAEQTKAHIVWFSRQERVDGAYFAEDALYFRGERVMGAEELAVQGEHNLENALAALAAARLMGIGNEAIVSAFSSFKGVAHRIERVFEANGVTFIDDSKATNVDSCRKALAALDRETVLILGGKDKGGALRTALCRDQAFARRARGAVRRERLPPHERGDGGGLYVGHALPSLRCRRARRLPHGAAGAERAPLSRFGKLRCLPQL